MRLCLLPLVWLLACGGCSGADDERMVIDPKFNLDQQVMILEATERWFEAIPDLRRPVYISDEPNIIREFGDAPTDGEYVTLGESFPFQFIALYTTAIESDEKFSHVALHELGHYFGVLGHVDDGQIMARYHDGDSTAEHCISAEDIAAVCDGIGGCEQETFPEC